MNAKPSFKSAPASCLTWENVTEGVWTRIFRTYHHDVMIAIPATATSAGTTPLSRRKYTMTMLISVPKSAPNTPILARSRMRRIP